MKKELYQLYLKVVECVNGISKSPFDIIDTSATLYVKYMDVLTPNLQEVMGKCLLFVNKDFEGEMTFDEMIGYGDELVEELSGCLGEYFDD